MKTKDAIKQAARTLFNQRGLGEVTLRDVAQALGRSYGNVTYHYPNKEPLIESLYVDMTAALSEISAGFIQTQDPLEAILKAPQQTFAISMDYIFLFRDYLEVIRSHPTIAATIRHSNESRMVRLRAVFLHLRSQGLLRPELEDEDIDYLMELSGAMRTFFFLQLSADDQQKPGLEARYVRYVNRLLYPYLSEAGQAIYQRQA